MTIFRFYLLATLPAALVSAMLNGAWHAVIGRDVLAGMLGGALAILWSFPLIGFLTDRLMRDR